MNTPGASGRWPIAAAWFLFAVVAATFLVLRLQLSFDLSAFFPTRTGPHSEVLLQQLSSGPGSRMMVGGIGGATQEERIETARLMVQALQSHPGFSVVYNGESDIDAAEIPEPLASGFPLMADIDYSPESIRNALQARLADLSFGGGRVLRELIARDPFLVTLDLLARLGPGGAEDEPWIASDGSAVFTAQTRAAGTDLAAQASALTALRKAFDEVKTRPDLSLTVTGVGAFGIELQSVIQKESRLLGILAGSAIMLVLLLVYRSLKLALLAAIPLGLGYMAGVAAVSLAFETVHGITLAFGFTLLGVTVDYPLHLFSHSRQEGGSQAIRSIWPTLRLGAASTATAYLAMVFSGSQGLSQLGLFTAVGVAVALLVTRTLLPGFLPPGCADGKQGQEIISPDRKYAPALAGLVITVSVLFAVVGERLWNDAMETLSPVPGHLLQTDQRLRSATASADMRYQVTVEATDLESLLKESERVDGLFQAARARGLLEGWSSVTALLPSQQSQQRRLAAIPGAEEFSGILATAVAETPFTEAAFTPFEAAVESARNLFPITSGSFDDTPLDSWRDAHLLKLPERWVALYTLEQPDVEAMAPLVSGWGESVRWIDLKEASRDLMRDFRSDAALAVGAAALIIAVLLLIQRVAVTRLAWISLTVSAALAVSVLAAVLVHGYLTLVHLVALLLVLGLGLDYALFFSRDESAAGRRATVQSILACSASTTLAFGILATSTIPLLKFIGLTVATGSVANLLFAWLGSRHLARAA